jgi:4-amino-4-deoxy-L-arabinose transferase-like glycosyltransferase
LQLGDGRVNLVKVHSEHLVSVTKQALTDNEFESKSLQPPNRWLVLLLLAVCLFVLFYQIGAGGLFEPDEGRNAEKAREILLLNDWITPHENFFPVLDKPMFFYWLVAMSYKAFGVSEWAARLPSALAASGCLALIYMFVRRRWGPWEALWSGLIMISGVEFFILSRVVIFDMSLTFCTTLALYSFYEAAHTEERTRRRIYCLLMYGALAAGTLIKGLVGLIIPGLIIFFSLCLTKQWSVLRGLYLFPGTLLFLAIIAPWYLLVETRNVGFLRYYLWDEHFGRFATASFDRKQPWYFFLAVLVVGFLPWSMLLPSVIKRYWSRSLDEKNVFITLWFIVPLTFFSISSSKLPHYILPIFPALSVLTATTLVGLFQNRECNIKRPLAALWWLQSLAILYLVSGLLWPAILPRQLHYSLPSMAPSIWLYAVTCVVILAVLGLGKTAGLWRSHSKIFIVHALGAFFFMIFLAQMKVAVSGVRSAEDVADTVAARIGAETQVVFYDTYLSGMPFYLRAQRPVWIVTHASKKKTVAGNFYVVTNQAWPETRWGKALFDFDEFREAWRKNKTPLLMIVKQKNLSRMEKEIGDSPRRLTTIDEYVLLTNR